MVIVRFIKMWVVVQVLLLWGILEAEREENKERNKERKKERKKKTIIQRKRRK
jgi:hypothetical protein